MVFETRLCGKYDYSRLTSEDYVNRIYKGKGSLPCRGLDQKFERLDGVPSVDIDKKQLSILYETSYDDVQVCGVNSGTAHVKVKDVFFEDRTHHWLKRDNSKFTVFRYISPVDQFENGLDDFDKIVSGFEWINPEAPTK